MKTIFEPFHAWRRQMPSEPFDRLGEEKLRAMIAGPHVERVRHYIGIDRADIYQIARLASQEQH